MPEPHNKAEGWFLLHEIKKIHWNKCNKNTEKKAENLRSFFEKNENSSLYSILGDSSDLMFIHIRSSLEELDAARRKLNISLDFLETKKSYLSVTELGGYTNEEIEQNEISEYAERKLYPDLSNSKYMSFYPMSRKRGEDKNWYTLSKEKREKFLTEHRKTGRNYKGEVNQIVSGSIGLDDWEFGVTLFGDNPISFKHIVYDMRFDKASSLYSVFGPFYTGIYASTSEYKDLLEGKKIKNKK